jgi:hypothetical protein
MVWVRLDDSFPDHRKIAELGDYAPLCGWLFICGLAYCNRQLTDGLIPKGHVVRLSSFRRLSIETGGVPGMMSMGDDIDADTLALLLESVGLWEDRETHWYIHDYPDYQPTKAEVEAERANKQAAGRAGGQASAQARAQRLLGEVLPTNLNGFQPPSPSPSPSPSPDQKREKKERIYTPHKRAISEEDKPTDKHFAFGKSLGLDVGPEWGKFKNYCLAHDKRYANFDAAFRNWLANAAQYTKEARHVLR